IRASLAKRQAFPRALRSASDVIVHRQTVCFSLVNQPRFDIRLQLQRNRYDFRIAGRCLFL
ncbi:MAG: hypothetical protein ACRD4P_12030, partial [Bryobacteraceae bacterium]